MVISPWYSDLLGVLNCRDLAQSLALTPEPVLVVGGESD